MSKRFLKATVLAACVTVSIGACASGDDDKTRVLAEIATTTSAVSGQIVPETSAPTPTTGAPVLTVVPNVEDDSATTSVAPPPRSDPTTAPGPQEDTAEITVASEQNDRLTTADSGAEARSTVVTTATTATARPATTGPTTTVARTTTEPTTTTTASPVATSAAVARATTTSTSAITPSTAEPTTTTTAVATTTSTTAARSTTTTTAAAPTTTSTSEAPATTTTTEPIARVVTRVIGTPFATIGELVLVHPASIVERIGYHESNHDGAQQMAPQAIDTQVMTLESRDRGNGSRTAADIVVSPNVEIVSPVTGTVKRSGSYTLYCDKKDHFVVIEPDARPGYEVKMLHIIGVKVSPGDRVVAGVTVLSDGSRLLPFASQVDEFTSEPSWPHVHIEVVDPTIRDRPGSGC